MIRKTLQSLFIATVAAAVLTGCGAQDAKQEVKTAEQPKIQVVASFYPMYEFTKQVGGDKVEVINLVPPGSEPHDWEPSPQDMATISKAKVLVYNGAGFEGWVEKVAKSSDNPNLVLIEASKGLSLLKADHGEEEHGDEHHDAPQDEHKDEAKKDDHDHGEFDPHVWLDPVLAKAQVMNIKEGLIQADPANKDYYEANAKSYGDKLDALDREFREAMAKVQSREFITTHKAFSYLAHRYGLKQEPIMGLAPDAEPKPQDMAAIVQFAKEHNVRYIFFETLVSPKVAETIANEIKAETLVLNPVEGLTGEDFQKGRDYLAVMRENLANLKKALGYKE